MVRIPCAKYMWDQLPEMREHLEEIIPVDIRSWTGDPVVAGPPGLTPPIEVAAEAPDDDLLDHPFIEEVGAAFGTGDDLFTEAECYGSRYCGHAGTEQVL